MLFKYAERESPQMLKLRLSAVKEKQMSSTFPQWLARPKSHRSRKLSQLLHTGVASTILLNQKQAALKDGVTHRDLRERDVSFCWLMKAMFSCSVPQIPRTGPLLCLYVVNTM